MHELREFGLESEGYVGGRGSVAHKVMAVGGRRRRLITWTWIRRYHARGLPAHASPITPSLFDDITERKGDAGVWVSGDEEFRGRWEAFLICLLCQ